MLRADEAAGGAAEQDGARQAAGGAAGERQQVAQGGAELHLVDTRPGHRAGQAEQLGAGGVLGADRRVGAPAVAHDRQQVDQRLHVVDRGRLAEQARLGRIGRLAARLAAKSLQRVEQRGLFAADVGAGTAPHFDVEVNPEAHDVAPEQAPAARLRDGMQQAAGGQRVLAANVQVAGGGADGEAGDHQGLDHGERILLHHHPVLERTRLRLVGVAHHVVRAGGGARYRLPLGGGREGGAAAALQPGVAQFAQHAGGS